MSQLTQHALENSQQAVHSQLCGDGQAVTNAVGTVAISRARIGPFHVDTKSLSEADVCAKFITPAVIDAGWSEAQIRREWYLTDGRILVRGKRKIAAYVTSIKPNIQIAAIEAEENTRAAGDGMQKALAAE